MNQDQLLDLLSKHNACRDATEWVRTSDKPTACEIWESCERGDWMDRFVSRVDFSGSCWTWTGTKSTAGYGMISFGGRLRKASHWSMEWSGGVIGKNHVLHKCDNPACVRPDHLFLGTHADNMRDKVSKGRQSRSGNGYSRKTHCPSGHPYSGDNLVQYKTYRYCRTCSTAHKQAHKQKKRAIEAAIGGAK